MILVGKSWVGQVRSRNEDVYWARPELSQCGVADGMGGYDYGHIAARMTADAITQAFREIAIESLDAEQVVQIIKQTNTDIHLRARDLPDVRVMGATLVMLQLVDDTAFIGHVGDSRCYRLRGSEVNQLTRDHSVVNQMIDEGKLTIEDAATSNVRNQVTQAIGPSMVVQPSVRVETVEQNDLYLLCSDGLSGFVSNEQLESTMIEHRGNLSLLVDRLINMASESGSTDNITVVLAAIS